MKNSALLTAFWLTVMLFGCEKVVEISASTFNVKEKVIVQPSLKQELIKQKPLKEKEAKFDQLKTMNYLFAENTIEVMLLTQFYAKQELVPVKIYSKWYSERVTKKVSLIKVTNSFLSKLTQEVVRPKLMPSIKEIRIVLFDVTEEIETGIKPILNSFAFN